MLGHGPSQGRDSGRVGISSVPRADLADALFVQVLGGSEVGLPEVELDDLLSLGLQTGDILPDLEGILRTQRCDPVRQHCH